MTAIFEGLLTWIWGIITGAQTLVSWLFTEISIAGYNVAPIYLVGVALITAGVIRAIIGIV